MMNPKKDEIAVWDYNPIPKLVQVVLVSRQVTSSRSISLAILS